MSYYGGVALKAVRAKPHSRRGNADDARREAGARKSAVKNMLKSVKTGKNMLKLFTLEYEERTVFTDALMPNFLADKEILRWVSHFFEHKNEYFWTVDHRPTVMSQTEPIRKTEKSRDESYKL